MNNEASNSASNQLLGGEPLIEDGPSSPTMAGTSSPENVQRQRKLIRKERTLKFLDHLVRDLDIIIYSELSVLYYMDCSLFRFLVRAIPQWIYFTPKPPVLPQTPTTGRPYIGIIFGLNFICLALHLFANVPAAGEATRGYLYGGMLIDFVGQLSPVSRARLAGHDILVLALQLVRLAVDVERKRVDSGADLRRQTTHPNLHREQDEDAERQNHDFEERGIMRGDGIDEYEMQSLRPCAEGRTGGDEDRERDELLQDQMRSTEHPEDAFNTGQRVIADLHIVDTVREQWRQYKHVNTDTTGSASNRSVGAAAATALARRRFRFRFRVGGRQYGSG